MQKSCSQKVKESLADFRASVLFELVVAGFHDFDSYYSHYSSVDVCNASGNHNRLHIYFNSDKYGKPYVKVNAIPHLNLKSRRFNNLTSFISHVKLAASKFGNPIIKVE